MKNCLAVVDIHKNFKNKTVLENITLNVKPYDIYGLIALNGIGKTTLIKIILNLINAEKGSIELFDQKHDNHQARLHLGYLPEKFLPSPFLKGKEFLENYLSAYNMTYDHNTACNIATSLDLDPTALDIVVKKYSKGMGQKLGLIALFLQNPKLMILDEPMSGLDPKARVCLKMLMRDYASRGGAIFFSSHILADIDEISTKIAVIHDKNIIYTGTSENFCQAYPGSNLEHSFIKAIS